MKAIYHIKVSLLTLAAMVACTEMEINNESQDSTNNGLLQELTITGKDFQFEDATRSSVTIGESGASFTWDEDDVIGIFPDKGDQVSFDMAEGAGTQTATFSGGGWALKSSSRYAAYYPHVYENRDMTKIPVSYVGQTQNGNANTDHIGAYDFMAASVTTPENGAVAFDMQHLGCLVQLNLTIPEPANLCSIEIGGGDKFFWHNATYDLTSDDIIFTGFTKDRNYCLTIDLKNIKTIEKNQVVTIYFMMNPVDLSNKEIVVTANCWGGGAQYYSIIKFDSQNQKAGYAYKWSTALNKREVDSWAVDLGLPSGTSWSKCNLGATSPEDCGDYFAWGETTSKGTYTASNSLWQSYTLEKLKTSNVVNNYSNLNNSYDAATVEWGDGWRMPTSNEFEELVNNCAWTWIESLGVFEVVSTIDGFTDKGILIPLTGHYQNAELHSLNSHGIYWTSTAHLNIGYSYSFRIDTGTNLGNTYSSAYNQRYIGLNIRPVKSK